MNLQKFQNTRIMRDCTQVTSHHNPTNTWLLEGTHAFLYSMLKLNLYEGKRRYNIIMKLKTTTRTQY